MKKVTYLLVLMFSLTLMSTSCDKDEPIVPDKTLEQLYPDWANLTWVSTDGWTDPDVAPNKLNITIVGNKVTFNQPPSYNKILDKITIQGDIIKFGEVNGSIDIVSGTFTNDGSYITIKTYGLYTKKPEFYHTYVLKIN